VPKKVYIRVDTQYDIMDFLEFVCVMTALVLSGGIIMIWLSTRNALIMQDLAEKRRISLERSKAARARYQQDEPDLAPWVNELVGALGVSPEALFADEMPPELAKLMPLAKGFLQGGGLQKIMAASQSQGKPDEERSAI
jgi:hypothetical protein